MKRLVLLVLAVLLICVCFAERGTPVTSESIVEQPPLPLAGVKIGIDPGHQAHANNSKEPVAPGSSEMKAKVASGTAGVSTRRPEHEIDLEISLKLRDLLVSLGAEVLMSRETADVDISNVERAVMMNDWGADLVIRVHCDGSTDRSIHGIGMYVRKTGTCAHESYLLGEKLLNSVAKAAGAPARGVYRRDTYTGLNWSTVPCVLAEFGYMSNPAEDEKLCTPEYQEQLVYGAAQGIINYLDALESEIVG